MKKAIAATTLAAAAIIAAPAAQASPGLAPETGMDNATYSYAVTYGHAVCAVLDEGMTRPGHFVGIGASIMKDGLTVRQAGQVIGFSVAEYCPEHSAALLRWVNS